jgi:shikimate dehydrogenase
MHNAAAEDLGLDLAYIPLPVKPDDLHFAVSGLVAMGFYGANVTVPHKEAVTQLMDGLDPAAQTIGAVNTIVIRKNSSERVSKPTLIGYNTDYYGFLADLEEKGWSHEGENCLVLGAGGSARAVAYGLAKAGARVSVTGRRMSVCLQHPPSLIVNATPVGMEPAPDESPWPAEQSFPKSAFVYDLVYKPAETMFIRQASAAGRKTANGSGMLVQQGARAFELWTGVKPNTQIMANALL